MRSVIQNARRRRQARTGLVPRPSGRVAILRAAVALLLLFAWSCSNQDGGTEVLPETCIEFIAAEQPGAGTVVSRAGSGSTCDQAVVELVVTDVDDIYALGTLIEYDRSVASFSAYSATGSLLFLGGSNIIAVVNEIAPGQIELGLARVQTTGVDVTGTDLLMTLVFDKAVDSGSGTITLEDECLLGSEEPPQPKPGLRCVGGTLVVR